MMNTGTPRWPLRWLRAAIWATFAVAVGASLTAAQAAETRQYTTLHAGRTSGAMTVTSTGSKHVIDYGFSVNDRGPRLRAEVTVNAAGEPAALTISGTDPVRSPVRETLTSKAGERYWTRPGSPSRGSGTRGFYMPATEVPEMYAMLSRVLLKNPSQAMPLLPSGHASATEMTRLSLETPAGLKVARLIFIKGLDRGVIPVWVDAEGQLFAIVQPGNSIILKNWEDAVPRLSEAQNHQVSAHDAAITERIADRPSGPVLIRNVRLFDSLSKVMRPEMSVLFEGNRILAVEPVSQLVPPAGVRIIEGRGATLLPGMWDMHVHIQSNLDGLLHLAHGITSARDMGNDPAAILRWRKQFSTGELAGPHLMLAGLIDGKGDTAAAGMHVATAAELSRAITMFADNGYDEIKIYSSFPLKLLPQAISEAHARGLRVGGHVPAGLRMDDVVKMGFDDVSHAYFVLLNFLGDDVQAKTNTMARVLVPARRGVTIDVESARVSQSIAEFRKRGVALDATLKVVAALFGDGASHPGVLPRTDEERELYARSAHVAYRIIKKMFDAGIPIVPGTDGLAGEQYVDELLTYRDAGIQPLDVLQMATLVPARMMKLDRDLGSIAPGKLADMILVEGDPSEDLSTLRNLRLTIRNGDLYYRERIEAELGEL